MTRGRTQPPAPGPSAPSSARLALLQISLAGVLWGTGGLAVQLIRDRVPMSVLTISAWRMGLAAVVLLLVVLVRRQLPELRRLLRERPGTAIAVGLCTGAYQALYFGSVVAVGVTVSTVVALGLAPLALTVVEAVAARQAPGRNRWLVLVAALAGLVLVSSSAGLSETGPRPGLGVALAAASGAMYAVATGLSRPIAGSTSPLALATVTSTAGAVGLVPLGLWAQGPHMSTDPEVVALLLYLGVMTLALAYALLYAGLRTVVGSSAVIATLLEPVTAAVLAALLLGERLGWAGILGAALVLAALGGLESAEQDDAAVPGGPAPL